MVALFPVALLGWGANKLFTRTKNTVPSTGTPDNTLATPAHTSQPPATAPSTPIARPPRNEDFPVPLIHPASDQMHTAFKQQRDETQAAMSQIQEQLDELRNLHSQLREVAAAQHSIPSPCVNHEVEAAVQDLSEARQAFLKERFRTEQQIHQLRSQIRTVNETTDPAIVVEEPQHEERINTDKTDTDCIQEASKKSGLIPACTNTTARHRW